MRSDHNRRVAVIGGGISGLAAAFHLRELAASREFPLEVTLLEAGDRVGGAIRTIRRDGFIIETGADSFLSEKPAALNLAERLGLSGSLVKTQEQFRKTYIVRDGRLVEIPEGFSLMAPTFLGPVMRSPLFSMRGKLRIMLEPIVPRGQIEGDESLAAFVTRRLGREVLERVAQPLAGGIYTADPEQLSVQATMPRFVEMERRHGSLIRGLKAAAQTRSAQARGTSGARWSLFLSFNEGMSTIVDALARRIGESIRYRAEVAEIARVEGRATPSSGWKLALADGSTLEADAIVCTAPAFAAARLLRPHNQSLAAALAAIRYASAATVNLAYRTTDFPNPPKSFGFVVPVVEHRKIIAGSFSSLKFPGRAPGGIILARVFFGGALQTAMMRLGDDEMITAAREEFAALLGVTAEPILVQLQRWADSMPQYAVGHLDRVSEIEREAATVDGLELAGAYLRGVGIPDCIRSGESAADAIFEHISRESRAT